MTKASRARATKVFNRTEPVMTVQLKFNAEQRKAILGFISELNQSDDGALDMQPVEFCTRAVFYAINDARKRAIELTRKQEELGSKLPTSSNSKQEEGSTDGESSPTESQRTVELLDTSTDSTTLSVQENG